MSVVGRLGTTFLGGLQGTFGIPRSAGITAYWATEGNAPTDGAVTIDQVVMTPRTIGARQDFTRAFMNQTSLDVEAFAANTIIKTIAVGLDQAAVQGSGASGQPLGILNNTNCNMIVALSGTSSTTGAVPANLTGSAMTFAHAVKMETLVANANAMLDSGAYLFNTASNGALKVTGKVDPNNTNNTYTGFVSMDGEVNGYPAFATNIVPAANGTNNSSGAGVFGNWADMIIGNWGALDLMVDPYALSTSGGLRVIGLQDADVELRHALSFARMYGIAP